jgi:cytidine deaminase
MMFKHAKALGKPGAIFLHAEVACLIKARGEDVYKLVVIRHGAKGPLPAKPCPICQRVIQAFNVKRVEHT